MPHRRIQFLIVIFTLLCTAASVSAGSFASIEEVDPSDGISQTEAQQLAEHYFYKHISGCGYPATPTSEGGMWQSKTYLGIAGQPGPPIYIDMRSGEIIWQGKRITLMQLKQNKVDEK